jgi:hypothetical protein
MSDNYGNLVLTVRVNDASDAEAVQLIFALPNGDTTAVFVELASGLKPCRCGAALKKARLRIVAPTTVRVSRVPRLSMPVTGGCDA